MRRSEPIIPYGRQDISQADIDAVVEVLRSEFLTQGPKVPLFEQSVSTYCGAKYAVAVNSATSALHIACMALEVGPGDWLWTSPITFVASANCGLYCGAKIDFVDIDPRTCNMCPQALESKLLIAEREGRLPKVVVPVHLCGQSADMRAIHLLAQRFGFKIIEDASHAIGGKYRGEPVGNCRYSDITVFSFHPVKIITTCEGGMAMTNNPELASRMNRHRSHGITGDANKMHARPADEIWNYQQISLGFNYRMTDVQAVLGLSQMTRLDEFVRQRQAIAKRYDSALADLPLKTPWQHPDSYSSYHLYPIRLKLVDGELTQRKAYDALHGQGILVNLHYIPVYRQPYYEAMGFKQGYCPESEQYFREALSIPMFSAMTPEQENDVVRCLREMLDA
ncbi:UDP-4-amino-4,6-dideoxy-N-acetyl-beta-L-altrosamine transaminase [Zwartia vadi]|uniref:UDP-4-amino-4, 6-dideoxy-N-acetyl-beta-L-altrosamine transaminase n=1 Tax=Zwartia vadi TaxID=3058168 RepID=UPI0025B35C0C|nr:UDP-4-amino-4,6-dideoxy-N-acetyl-beta-L-altrosamine transaminase [Zwartia vadi]MDN3988246.1 UDP-4-amino-4,6-dideoxy-N-acetyl-beta-L-altrosamine transaminase [Zwartia vadi]